MNQDRPIVPLSTSRCDRLHVKANLVKLGLFERSEWWGSWLRSVEDGETKSMEVDVSELQVSMK